MRTPPRSTLDGLDRALVVAIAVVIGLLTGLVPVPSVDPRAIGPGVGTAFDSITAIILVGVTLLAWLRYRERGEPVALFQAAAFLILALANISALAVGILASAGAMVGTSGLGVAYVASAARLVAAALLVAGGSAPIMTRLGGRPAVVLVGPLLVLSGTIVLAGAITHSLAATAGLDGGATMAGITAGAATPLGMGLQIVCGGLFLVAAVLTRRLYRRAGTLADAYLALGLVFAATGNLYMALNPSERAGFLGAGDLLRLAFDVTLFLGIEAEARATMRALRGANATLERLRASEAERASAEERARMARELHDGLAQDLWLAKLRAGRLAGLADLGSEAEGICRELDSAIDSGLAAARQAVLSLRSPARENAALPDLLRAFVEDFEDRFALQVDVDCPAELPRFGTRAEAEMLRIAQEALNNVARHADATVVRVGASFDGSSVTLTVDDNGRGFDPAHATQGFGLTSMRERATLIGGELTIASSPLDGTRVHLELPLPDAPRPATPPGGSVHVPVDSASSAGRAWGDARAASAAET